MTIPAYHSLYCQLTGRDLTLDYLKESCWVIWLRYRKHEPFTADDLKLVVRFLKHEIKAGERKEASLKFQNLIASPDWFEESLQDARAWAKRPNPASPRAVALRSAGIPDKAGDKPVKSAAQVLSEAAWVKQHLTEWRKANP